MSPWWDPPYSEGVRPYRTHRHGGQGFLDSLGGAFHLMRNGLLILLFAVLPMGTAAMEIATGLALAGALWLRPDLSRFSHLLVPAALIALALQAASPGVAAAGLVWPRALLGAVPVLLGGADRERVIQVGLMSAAVVGVGSLLLGSWPSQGPFSHHLTLGYALIPPLAMALHRRSWLAVGIAAGVVASASSGPALSAAVVAVAVLWRPSVALVGGVVVSLVLMAVLVQTPELAERAVLWTSGAAMATEQAMGVGPEAARSVAAATQDRLSPGFYFPHHAHDSALQVAGLAGMGVWVGWAWLLWSLWNTTGVGGRAALAGVLIGSMTQDTLGDLEVIRALCAWVLIEMQPDRGSAVRSLHDRDDPERSPT